MDAARATAAGRTRPRTEPPHRPCPRSARPAEIAPLRTVDVRRWGAVADRRDRTAPADCGKFTAMSPERVEKRRNSRRRTSSPAGSRSWYRTLGVALDDCEGDQRRAGKLARIPLDRGNVRGDVAAESVLLERIAGQWGFGGRA